MHTVEDVLKEIAGIKSFVDEKLAAGLAPLGEETARLSADLTAVTTKMQDIRRNAVLSAAGGPSMMVVREGKFAGFDPLQLSIARSLLRERYQTDTEWEDWSETKAKAQIDTAIRSLGESASNPEVGYEWYERAMKSRRAAYGDAPQGMEKFGKEALSWRNMLLGVSRKAMDSTTATSGDELVSTLQAAQLWLDVNLDTVILPLMQQIAMPSNPYDIPTQLGDTNWYPISENIAGTTTDLSTNKTTLNAKGLKTGVPFSDELSEDAIIALVPEISKSLSRNAAEVIDDVLLNGDTTEANGINSDGATITASTAGKAHWLLGFDGLIHLPIVDNTSQGIDHNAAVTADVYNEVLSKMGKYAAPSRRGDVFYATDVNTAIRSLSITEFETVDTAGARATLSSGEILNVYGKPLVHTAQMRLADTDGKVTDSGNGEDNGRILAVNTSQWRVGFRRQITVESEREASKGQTTLWVSFRLALAERTGTRSSATHTAMAYNITGV
tara:strand:+ start:346 stop:1842 length:1497 start_codon:yes stop_codon:yes gene_type:complete